MQQTIVLLYAEVTVAIHSFDLKGGIHYRRDFTYSSFQTGERGTCQARGNCSRSGSHGIHIKAALSHRTKGRAYRCNAGACPKGYPAQERELMLRWSIKKISLIRREIWGQAMRLSLWKWTQPWGSFQSPSANLFRERRDGLPVPFSKRLMSAWAIPVTTASCFV